MGKVGSVKAITQPRKPEQVAALAETHRRPLVRAEVIAKHFDVHKRTVALWAERGDIPCHRVGGALRFDMEAVLGASQ
jgi:excisionase family DNA binding protein